MPAMPVVFGDQDKRHGRYSIGSAWEMEGPRRVYTRKPPLERKTRHLSINGKEESAKRAPSWIDGMECSFLNSLHYEPKQEVKYFLHLIDFRAWKTTSYMRATTLNFGNRRSPAP